MLMFDLRTFLLSTFFVDDTAARTSSDDAAILRPDASVNCTLFRNNFDELTYSRRNREHVRIQPLWKRSISLP